jgi:AbrB family looped-hinge helix DNA binding protein
MGPGESRHQNILIASEGVSQIIRPHNQPLGDKSYYRIMSYLEYNVRIMIDTFTTVSSKGQIVIPAELRERLGIEAGTRIAVRIERDHLIILEPINEGYIRRLRGSLKGPVSMVEAREREKRLEK